MTALKLQFYLKENRPTPKTYLLMLFRVIGGICILTFGWFLGVRILYADVSEHCQFHLHWRCKQDIRIYIYIFSTYTAYEFGTDSVFRNVGISNSDVGEHPKVTIQHSEHGENLKSEREASITTRARNRKCDIMQILNFTAGATRGYQ